MKELDKLNKEVVRYKKLNSRHDDEIMELQSEFALREKNLIETIRELEQELASRPQLGDSQSVHDSGILIETVSNINQSAYQSTVMGESTQTLQVSVQDIPLG